MEKEKEGFPITSLREINCLLKAKHPNIVNVREIVVGSNMDKIYIVMDYVEHDLKGMFRSCARRAACFFGHAFHGVGLRSDGRGRGCCDPALGLIQVVFRSVRTLQRS